MFRTDRNLGVNFEKLLIKAKEDFNILVYGKAGYLINMRNYELLFKVQERLIILSEGSSAIFQLLILV